MGLKEETGEWGKRVLCYVYKAWGRAVVSSCGAQGSSGIKRTGRQTDRRGGWVVSMRARERQIERKTD